MRGANELEWMRGDASDAWSKIICTTYTLGGQWYYDRCYGSLRVSRRAPGSHIPSLRPINTMGGILLVNTYGLRFFLV
jgi:hypothetical protein